MALEANDNSTSYMRNHVKLRLVTTNFGNRHSYPGRVALLPTHLMQIIDLFKKTRDSYVKVPAPAGVPQQDIRRKLALLPFIKNFAKALAKIVVKRSAR